MTFLTARYRILIALSILFFATALQANARYYPELYNFYFHFAADTNRYPISDRYGDPYSNPNRNTFDLKDTAFIKRNIEYDPKTKQYYIVEKNLQHLASYHHLLSILRLRFDVYIFVDMLFALNFTDSFI